MKIYIAGKVSKNSSFGRHDWRDGFVAELSRISGLALTNLDPTTTDADQSDPQDVFGCDAKLISESDGVVVYLSDDISVGGSQEILIAKYFGKPVIGLAPLGGKFNGTRKEFADRVITDYRDPFVFSTCDRVCATVEEVAQSLKELEKIEVKSLDCIDQAITYYVSRHVTTRES